MPRTALGTTIALTVDGQQRTASLDTGTLLDLLRECVGVIAVEKGATTVNASRAPCSSAAGA